MELGDAAGSKDKDIIAAANGKDKGKGKDNSKVEQMTVDMAKLLLSHDESIGQLELIAFNVFIIPKKTVVMAAGKLEGQKYHGKC